MAELNGKIVFTADTRKFDEGAKKVRKGVKDLEGVSKSALGSIGDAFGVNTGKVGQMSSALVGLGDKLKNCGSTGGQAIGKLVTGFGGLGAAIGGLGLGAAIASFQRLNAVAEHFGNTINGINQKMAIQQFSDTYTNAMMDSLEGTANGWMTLMGKFKVGGARLLAGTGNLLAGQSWQEMRQADAQAMQSAATAAKYASQMAEYQKQQIANSVIIATNEAEIAEQTRIAKDQTASKAERDAAAARAAELIEKNYNLQAGVLRGMVVAQTEINKQSSNTLDDEKNLASLQVQLVSLNQQRAQQLTALDRVERSIAKSTGETKQNIADMLPDLSAASREITNSLLGGGGSISRVDNTLIAGTLAAQNKAVVQIPAKIVPKVDQQEVQKAVLDMVPVIEESFSVVGDALGGLIGDLATGGDAWANFGNAALSAMGDMAIQVGRMAIGAGVATLGIKKALESLNGYAAIAAGTALVALGAAVKTGLSNIASGSYSAGTSSSVASSGYASSPGSFERAMTVNVVGTLKADGNQLVAVLNNETNRRNISA